MMNEDETFRYLVDCGAETKWFTVRFAEVQEFHENPVMVPCYIKDGDEFKPGAFQAKRVILWQQL